MLVIEKDMQDWQVDAFFNRLSEKKPFIGMCYNGPIYHVFHPMRGELLVDLDETAKLCSFVREAFSPKSIMVAVEEVTYAKVETRNGTGEVLHLERKKNRKLLFKRTNNYLTARLEVPDAADGGYAYGPLTMAFISAIVGGRVLSPERLCTPELPTCRVSEEVRPGPVKSYYEGPLGEIQKEILENRGSALTLWDVLTLAALWAGYRDYKGMSHLISFGNMLDHLERHVIQGLAVPPSASSPTIDEIKEAANPWAKPSVRLKAA